ncbi:MAG: hypothetical protein KGZ60_06580 [Truepera sp.]|nr:hypothetical protein [Truepera sp.]
MHLLIVDTTGIQPYIFGSNRLRENVGASHLVKQATEAWAREALESAVPARHNWQTDGTLDTTKRIEAGAIDAEVVYASGGNVVVIFKEGSTAQRFTAELSKITLCKAPGLQLVMAQKEFNGLGIKQLPIDDTFKLLDCQKRQLQYASTPLLGVAVTTRCQSTGLPAVGYVPAKQGDPASAYPASGEVLAKWYAGDDSHSALHKQFESILGQRFAFPKEMDDLGRSEGEHSYVAVVHADGNGMGQRIQDIRKTIADDREYITKIRQFSQELNDATQRALTSTLNTLKTLASGVQDGCIKHRKMPDKLCIKLKKEDNRWLLPFRPIVIGGDDVTFICDGRLGLSLALHYLKQFEHETAHLSDGKGKATACAGVAIVKSHYPFAKAYALAEELTSNAKAYWRTLANYDGACIDWHMAFSGLYGSIETIRKREYSGGLTIRPLTLKSNPGSNDGDKSWPVLQRALESFQSEEWLGKRNKMKALLEALREGASGVERFQKMYLAKIGQKLPDVGLGGDVQTKGFYGQRTPYFDAIELADWYLPLNDDSTGEQSHDNA